MTKILIRALAAATFLISTPAFAQEDDHTIHHPGAESPAAAAPSTEPAAQDAPALAPPAATAAPSTTPAPSATPGMTGGMDCMTMMQGMMCGGMPMMGGRSPDGMEGGMPMMGGRSQGMMGGGMPMMGGRSQGMMGGGMPMMGGQSRGGMQGGMPMMDFQGHGGMPMGAPPSAMSSVSDSPSTRAYRVANARMHAGMEIDYSGDADADFVRGMIAHHRGAIEMAETVLEYGKDPEIRKLAEGVIAAQEAEVATLRTWLLDHRGAAR
jgi:hypothetical protein